jgi:hypothetical protein
MVGDPSTAKTRAAVAFETRRSRCPEIVEALVG